MTIPVNLRIALTHKHRFDRFYNDTVIIDWSTTVRIFSMAIRLRKSKVVVRLYE